MNPAEHPYQRRFAYEAWANRASYRSIAGAGIPLPDRAIPILAHIIGSQRNWLARIDEPGQGSGKTPVWPEFGLEVCDRQLLDLARIWPTVLEANPPESLDRTVAYTNFQGEAHTNRIIDILEHVLVHGAYHRGQIATLIGRAGGTPATTDFIVWARKGDPAPEV